MDGWPRVVMTVAGIIVIVWMIATRQLYRRRRRYTSPWDVPTRDDPVSSPGGRVPLAARPDLEMPREPRPFRRVPRTGTEAVLKALVFAVAVGAVALLVWMAFAFATNLPGWS